MAWDKIIILMSKPVSLGNQMNNNDFNFTDICKPLNLLKKRLVHLPRNVELIRKAFSPRLLFETDIPTDKHGQMKFSSNCRFSSVIYLKALSGSRFLSFLLFRNLLSKWRWLCYIFFTICSYSGSISILKCKSVSVARFLLQQVLGLGDIPYPIFYSCKLSFSVFTHLEILW